MNLKTILNQPYPIPVLNWKKILLIGFSISLLMLLMQPFGLSSIHMQHKFWFLAGYGLVTTFILGFNLLFVIRLFSEYRWNIIKHILWSVMIVFELGLANYAYTFCFIDHFPFSLTALLIFQVYTFFIAIVPITFLVLITQNRLLKVNQTGAEHLTQSLENPNREIETGEKIVLISDNGKTQLEIPVSDLAFIESVGNYIHVYFQSGDLLIERTLRSSISKAETAIGIHKSLLKCHRAFIVNLYFVEAIKGNAQGYRLNIKNSEKEVYVSRQYTKILKEALR